MTYQLTVTEKNNFLHAVVTGENTRENVAHYLEDVLHECISRNFSRVLIEERLEGPRLGTMDVFDVASGGVGPARGKLGAIAYVDVNAVDDRMQFAEHVAVNRGLTAGVFKTVAAAEEWLIKSDSERTGSPNQSATTRSSNPGATTKPSTTDEQG